MCMLVPAPKEVCSPEQEKQLGESSIILSAAILVYSNWRRMASAWHNWFPFRTPRSKSCISPSVSKTTCYLLRSWIYVPAAAVSNPWFATSGPWRHRGGKRRRYQGRMTKEPQYTRSSAQAWGCIPALAWFHCSFPVPAIKTNCKQVYKIRIGAHVQTSPTHTSGKERKHKKQNKTCC